ncbi:MAG: winged helix DNA-binding protein [Chlamydiales bacterium]|nr:winged helix DNA-binding protein [Chlamydiales bacterium]
MEVDFEEISDYDAPEKSPGFLLWHLSTSWRSCIESALKEFDLTHPQFVVLATLAWLTRGGERVTQAKVGQLAGLDPNTTSQIVRGLERKGLLVRKSSTDARAKNPSLTAKGKRLLTSALPKVEDTDEAYFETLSENELNTLLQLFRKLTKKRTA